MQTESGAKKPLQWFLRQMIWFLGSLADEEVFEKAQSAATQPLKQMSIAAQDKLLAAYWFSMRSNFHDSRVLHIALDGGTLDKKPMVVGLIAKPSNLAMAFPPQALF